MGTWGEIIIVFLLSTVKFSLAGVPTAIFYGFPFFKAVLVTSLGGFAGAVVFIYMSEKILEFYYKRRAAKHAKNPNLVHAPKFTKRNKIIVRIKSKFGLPGIALLTPLLLSIPLGCFIAVRYFKNKHKVLLYMFCAVFFWSVCLSSFKIFFH